MSKFEFKKEDIYVNRTKTYPDYKIFVNDANVTINNKIETNANSAVSSKLGSVFQSASGNWSTANFFISFYDRFS